MQLFKFDAGDSVVVCVNNLGALSSLEMAVIARATINSMGNFRLIFLNHHKHPNTFFVVVPSGDILLVSDLCILCN